MSTMVAEAERAGFGFYDVAVFGTYSAARTPVLGPGGVVFPSFSFHTDATGISAVIGWRAPKSKKWHLSAQYSPAYYYQTSSTGFSASRFTPRQSADFSWGTPLTPRWTINTSLSVTWGDYNQLLLGANPEQILTGSVGTVQEFGTAFLANATGTGPSQALLTGQQNLIYGTTMLTGAASVGLSHTISQRMGFNISMNASRFQHLGGGNSGPQSPYLSQEGTFIGLNAGLTYALTLRTSMFGSATYSRSVSSLFTTPTAALNMGLSHRVTQHLFMSGSVGAGYILGSGPNSLGYHRTGWQAAFSTGYRIYRQSFAASVSRYVSDNFGLGANGSIYARVGWHWSPPASRWGISAGFSEMRLQGTQFGHQGYSVNAGVNKALAGRLFTSLRYGYGEGSGAIQVNNPVLANSRYQVVSLSFGFHPYFGRPDAGAFPGDSGAPGIP